VTTTSNAAIRVSVSRFSAPRVRALAALARRDFLIQRSYRLAFALDLLFGVIDVGVYYFISRTFSSAPTAALGGAPDYFGFALVGIALTVVIQAATTGLAFRIREEQLTGTLEAMVMQPLSTAELALGLCGLPFLFATARVVFYLVVATTLFGLHFPDADWTGLALLLVVTGLAMSAIGIASGAIVLVVKRGNSLAGLILFGMSVVGGAFFPVSVLPSWLEAIGKAVPTRFAYDGLRAALYRGSGWTDDLLVLVLFSAIGVPAAVWLFDRGIEMTRRVGSLAQY